MASYLEHLPTEEYTGRWGEKVSRDLEAGYTDTQVLERLHQLEQGMRELAAHLPEDANFWISGGISKGRAAAVSDLDGFVDCGGLPPEKLQTIRDLPGWNSRRLSVFLPQNKAALSPAGDWLIGNYYGGLSKETGQTRDIDLILVGRTDGKFDPSDAGMGEQSACFSREQVLRTDFLVELFQQRFQAKGYRIEFEPMRIDADGPVRRPAELEWHLG
ncbi:hypothetical protein JST97_29565 [bacterium]|nr:hypothetical protein [bacterium]